MEAFIRIRNETNDDISAEQMKEYAKFNCPFGWEVISAKAVIDPYCDFVVKFKRISKRTNKT